MILKPYVSSMYPTTIACQLPIFEFRLTIMIVTPITVIVDASGLTITKKGDYIEWICFGLLGIIFFNRGPWKPSPNNFTPINF